MGPGGCEAMCQVAYTPQPPPSRQQLCKAWVCLANQACYAPRALQLLIGSFLCVRSFVSGPIEINKPTKQSVSMFVRRFLGNDIHLDYSLGC